MRVGHSAHVEVSNCLFENNHARTFGGALLVDGDRGRVSVELSSRTLIRNNYAPGGNSIGLRSGSWSYVLPAPLAHYVHVRPSPFLASNQSHQSSTYDNPRSGSIDLEYPFVCVSRAGFSCTGCARVTITPHSIIAWLQIPHATAWRGVWRCVLTQGSAC